MAYFVSVVTDEEYTRLLFQIDATSEYPYMIAEHSLEILADLENTEDKPWLIARIKFDYSVTPIKPIVDSLSFQYLTDSELDKLVTR